MYSPVNKKCWLSLVSGACCLLVTRWSWAHSCEQVDGPASMMLNVIKVSLSSHKAATPFPR